MKKILFLCTGNSCRSQMAEGWAKKHWGHKAQFFSAGTKAHGVNPYAVQAMRLQGVDISKQTSKTIEELVEKSFDLVITLCDNAQEACPVFVGARTNHHGFEDPPLLAKNLTDEKAILAVYTESSALMESFITELPKLYPEMFEA